MPWVRFDDRFDDQDDIDMMSTDAIALNLCATTWSSRNLTDGFIPDARVRRLPGGTPEAVELLCSGEKPWWERVPGGYRLLRLAPPTREEHQRRAGGRVTAATRCHVYERDGHACVTCGSQRDLTVDHIVPISRGGDNDIENLRTLCRSCNSRKGGR